MQTVAELVQAAPAFSGMSAGHLELISGCAENRVFEDGEFVLREGEAADSFYLVREGTVAMETHMPQRGAITLETVHDGDLLGWSWLVEPYRVHLDARARGVVHTIRFDAACLRGKCDHDPVLGYELMRRFIPVIVERLQATRVQMLDVYGNDVGR
jgi:CRP-like cAMP-binding protein